MQNHLPEQKKTGLTPYLTPLAVWALSFGCAVGWGSFVMPGTTFLPKAGPIGTTLGLLIGAGIMIIIAVNYHNMMSTQSDAGGAYSFVSRIMGNDHGFLCAWMLILTYIAVIWANSTASSLIVRYLFGDIFCFGFSYQVFGYTIYLGEVLLSIFLLVTTGLICLFAKKAAAWMQIIGALLMFLCVTVCFIAVVVHRGGFSDLTPAYASTNSPALQVFAIVMLAPWAYIGFESISHSADEFKFNAKKKSLGIMIGALIAAALDYVMLTLCAGLAVPDGFADWGEYIAALFRLEGVRGVPTFYAAQQAMGSTGLILLGVAALCGILTALIGYYIALSRLLYKMTDDGVLRQFGKLNRKGVPSSAILCIMAVSCVMPLFGRTAIGWIVDVTTIGALCIYAYVSICAFIQGRREKRVPTMIWGVVGAIVSFVMILFFIIPALWENGVLAAESYLVLIIWCLMGMLVFRMLIRRDMERNMGKSGIVWVILLIMILFISFIWVQQMASIEAHDIIEDVNAFHAGQAVKAGLGPDNEIIANTAQYIDDRIDLFNILTHRNVIIQNVLILCSIIVIFSIYSLIKRREKQIEEEKRTAEENSRAKTTFLSNMSHDIRTPMNAIMGYTALAKREDVSDQVRDYLDKIDLSGNHLLSLINDILDMSRIESGKVDLKVAPYDLYSLADEINDMFALQAKSKSLNFVVDCSGVTDRYVICDKNRLSRVLMNLVSNAYKFTPEGGDINVTIRQTGREGDSASYVMTVSDTGIGMSPEFMKNIFNAFERERTSTVSKIQGTGLGMSIAKNLIELMGGTIEVESEQGKGTTFTIRVSFPLTSEISADAEQEASENGKENRRAAKSVDVSDIRLLLAEDNPINQEIACAILVGEGFQVDVAEDGKVAVEMISQAEPGTYSAVLMDVQMPVMDGYEASRAIRALDDERAEIPIIAVSANTFEDDRLAAKNAGMNAHLSKPYTPEMLIEILHEWIDLKDPTEL